MLYEYFEHLSPKNELKDLHSEKQRVLSEENADGKITANLVKAERMQISAFHGTDMWIRDRIRSITKAKLDSKNDTQEKEELLPGN